MRQKSEKHAARKVKLAGLFLVTGMIAGIFSVTPSIDSETFLTDASENRYQVIAAAVCQLILSFSYIGFAVLMYPAVRPFGSSLSMGFLCFRILAVAISVLGTVLLLALLTVSESYPGDTSANGSAFEAIGSVLKFARDAVNHIFMVVLLCIGNILLYALFFRSALIPRWLLFWGIGGSVLSLTASGLLLVRMVDIITPEYLLLNVPAASFELLLAGWLMIRGISSTGKSMHQK